MNLLILGLNYSPEPVGIGEYTRGLAVALAAQGHAVTVVCGKPYYPAWKVDPAFAGGGVRRTMEDGVRVVRLPLYVPAVPDGGRRLFHHASFCAAALPALAAEALRQRPDIVIGIAPSLISLAAARLVAWLGRAKLWIHIQDFELDAAYATGLLTLGGAFRHLARAFERWSIRADRISTISPQMCARLAARGLDPARIVEFRNWADLDGAPAFDRPSSLRGPWGIDRPHVALYSGNIANKQGIGIVIEAARALTHRRDLLFAICGEGPNRARLVEQARGLENVRFFDLQPRAALPELLALASVHLLPQRAGAADLMLPSKLINMLASGRPIVATASPGTGLACEVEGCGMVTPPDDAAAFARAVVQLVDDPDRRRTLGAAARTRAETRWGRQAILSRMEGQLRDCLAG